MSAAALKVFVDTSAWLALANNSDSLHARAVDLNQALLSRGVHHITTDAVLTEVANTPARPPLRHAAIRFLDAIFSSRRVTILHVDPDRFAQGWQLYKDRPDKDWGTNEGIREALAADRHFQQAGYTCLMELP